jgi:hypothetical protein
MFTHCFILPEIDGYLIIFICIKMWLTRQGQPAFEKTTVAIPCRPDFCVLWPLNKSVWGYLRDVGSQSAILISQPIPQLSLLHG